jgi:hypothetical protein
MVRRPPRSASLRTIRLTRSRIVPREFGWFEGLLGRASGEQVGDALHLFTGHCAPHRTVR